MNKCESCIADFSSEERGNYFLIHDEKGNFIRDTRAYRCNFCPRCGAKIEGDDDE